MSRRSTKRRLRRAGMGALPVLAILLLASGLVRLGNGTGSAIAKEIGDLGRSGAALTAAAQCLPEEEIAQVMAALAERESRAETLDRDLADRQIALAAARAEIETQLAELSSAEAELSSLLNQVSSAAEDDLTRLTAVYESMKPKEAAALFEEMEPQFSAGFLGRMRPDAAARIMAGLTPPTAYSISVMLAGRNASLPRN